MSSAKVALIEIRLLPEGVSELEELYQSISFITGKGGEDGDTALATTLFRNSCRISDCSGERAECRGYRVATETKNYAGLWVLALKCR